MRLTVRFQLLTCLLLFTPCAHSIMVKFGTKGGPIEPPPAPVPSVPPPKPYRNPAPVWEERSSDTPDPNAHWRPQLFIPQPRYTQVIYNPQLPAYNSAKQFVSSYIPQHKPIPAQPIGNYFSPTQIVSQLSSQSLPGLGLRYFVPYYYQEVRKDQQKRQDDAKHNEIETNEVNTDNESSSDLQWKLEKDAAKRNARNTQEGTPFVYQWPAYVPHRQQ